MNAPSPDPLIERPWLTCAKTIILMLPAVIACGLARTYVAPLAKEIIRKAGVNLSGYDSLCARTFFVMDWGPGILVAAMVALVLLELVAPRWRRRRLAVGAGIWLANVTVFFALLMLVAIVLVAAKNLAYPR